MLGNTENSNFFVIFGQNTKFSIFLLKILKLFVRTLVEKKFAISV